MSEVKTIPISKLKPNTGQIEGLPRNPRFIRDERFERLKQSIKELPSMLDLRELIVIPQNGHFVTIGGNMRLRAAKDLGMKELPCKVLPDDTDAHVLAEIAIKDNVGFGSDDYDILANEWDDFPLADWGMDISEMATDPTVDLSQLARIGDTYLSNAIRQIVLYYDVDAHADVLSRLDAVGKDADIVEDNSAVVLRLLEFYEGHNARS